MRYIDGMTVVDDSVLLIPGLYNSGPEHWQTLWQKQFGFARLEQHNWETPRCADWVAALESAVARSERPPVLVAHSLACTLVAHWAASPGASVSRVEAAMLVAPSDCERADFPAGTTGFTPIPRLALPFRSLLVASRNDRYTKFERAVVFSQDWGSRLVDAGDCGHITTIDGFGPWPVGL